MPPEEDEFTALYDANLPRIDLVGKGANGVPRFLIAKQDEASAGLLDPDFVRDLIAKSPEEATVPAPTEVEERLLPNGITLKGSAADIAAFIHAASERSSPAGVAKAKNDTADREKKAASGAAMPDGSYPIADRADLGKAIHAVGRGGASHDAIRKHIITRARSLGASSEIPDNWNSDGSLKGDVSKEAGVADQVSKDVMAGAGDAVVLDEGIDGMDPTTPLAAPGDGLDAPGDPTDPGSPAWEAIDAATAQKWAGILARAKNALCMLAEREMLEAASADPDDAENAFSLEDAACAIDYAIGNLAVFAAGEQAEAEIGAEMAEMCKALAGFDTAHLDAAEGLAAVAKSGRVLSAANEAAIRQATESLQKVLDSLPSAPQAAEPVSKEKGAVMPAAKTATAEDQARDAGPVNAGGTTGLGEPRATGTDASLPGDGPQQSLPGDVPGRQVVKAALTAVYDQGRRLVGVTDTAAVVTRVAKAGGDGEKQAMQAVFDQDGDLIGIVDPGAIQPVTGAGAKPAADSTDGGGAQDAAPDPGDMAPQPPADAGTPAGQVGKAAGAQNVITLTSDVAKSIAEQAAKTALETAEAAHREVVAKMAADKAELASEVEALKSRLETVESMPAAPRVFANGQRPPEGDRPLPAPRQMRGQDQGGQPANVAKARELKDTLYRGTAPEQKAAFDEMQQMAVDQLTALHAGRR
jgi:hypothetical protein